jgi:hypothetical protein
VIEGDESQGIQIPKTDIVDGQGGASTGPGSGKGNGKATPRVVLSDTEVSSDEDDAPPQRRMRVFCSAGPQSADHHYRDSRLLWRPVHYCQT